MTAPPIRPSASGARHGGYNASLTATGTGNHTLYLHYSRIHPASGGYNPSLYVNITTTG